MAAGAVLAFAVHIGASGVDLHTIGIILLVVGAIAIVLSAIFWSSWGGSGYWRNRGGPPVAPGPPVSY